MTDAPSLNLKKSTLYPDWVKHVREKELIESDARIVIACSGGLDSMVLLHLLSRVSRTLNLHLIVAHVNYHLRGEASDRDCARVMAFAKHEGLEGIYADAPDLKSKPGNFQDHARAYRYQFFEKILIDHACDTIVTAHHRDDQLETRLHRLLRGAGFSGITGISPISERMASSNNASRPYRLLRPLLTFSKQELETYATQESVPYGLDQSNFSPDYTRNRIRHELIPLLRELSPQLETRFEQMSSLCSDLSQMYDDAIQLFKRERRIVLIHLENQTALSGFHVSRDWFLSCSTTLRRELLYRLLKSCIPSHPVSRETLDTLLELIAKNRAHALYHLPNGFYFEKDAQTVYVRSSTSEQLNSLTHSERQDTDENSQK